MRILIVEDDARLANVLRDSLVYRGHVVDVVHDGRHGADLAKLEHFDAIVLDVMLPGSDGISVARELRAAGRQTPILMLTAKDLPTDVAAGLDAGADDYMRKPFTFTELDARLRAVTRRDGRPRAAEEVRAGDIVLDLVTRQVSRRDREIALSVRETAFLEIFLRRPNALLTRAFLETALWVHDHELVSNVIDVYVGRIRRKLTVDGVPPPLETIRGAGYRLSVAAPDKARNDA